MVHVNSFAYNIRGTNNVRTRRHHAEEEDDKVDPVKYMPQQRPLVANLGVPQLQRDVASDDVYFVFDEMYSALFGAFFVLISYYIFQLC